MMPVPQTSMISLVTDSAVNDNAFPEHRGVVMKSLFLILAFLCFPWTSFAGTYADFAADAQASKTSLLAISNQDHLLLAPQKEWCSRPAYAAMALTPDGKLDAEFRPETPTNPLDPQDRFQCQISQLITLKSGQLLQVTNAENLDFFGAFLTKINADGTTNIRFGKKGFVPFFKKKRATVVVVYEHSDETIYGINVQCEYASGGKACSSYLFHLLKDGSFDTKFGDNGFVLRNVSTTYDGFTNMAPAQLRIVDGKIIVVEHRYQFNHEIHLFKYQMNGSLMAGFDATGGRTLRVIRAEQYHGGHCVADSKLTQDSVYIASGCDDDKSAIVTRHHLNGDLDPSFGNGQGQVVLPLNLVSYQRIPFVNIAALASGQIAVSIAVAWPAANDNGSILTSVLTTHLDSTGQLGKWGKSEKFLPGPVFHLHAESVVDSQNRVILMLEGNWVVTTPMI